MPIVTTGSAEGAAVIDLPEIESQAAELEDPFQRVVALALVDIARSLRRIDQTSFSTSRQRSSGT